MSSRQTRSKLQSWLVIAAILATATPRYAHAGIDEASSAARFWTKNGNAIRWYENAVHSNEDHTILCFDGQIMADQDAVPFRNLQQGGTFVVRSAGGTVKSAIMLANILNEKNATVV